MRWPCGRDGAAPPCSYRSRTPARSASRSTASAKLNPSVRCTNAMTSPPTPQPKQWKRPRAGVTLKDGDFSSWNGHSPLRLPPPALRSATRSPITSSIADRSRTSAMSSSLIRPATRRSYAAPADPAARAASTPVARSREHDAAGALDLLRQQIVADFAVGNPEGAVGRTPQLAGLPPGREGRDHPCGRCDPLYRPHGGTEVAVGRHQHRGVVAIEDGVLDQGDRDADVGLLLLVRVVHMAAPTTLDSLLLESTLVHGQ